MAVPVDDDPRCPDRPEVVPPGAPQTVERLVGGDGLPVEAARAAAQDGALVTGYPDVAGAAAPDGVEADVVVHAAGDGGQLATGAVVEAPLLADGPELGAGSPDGGEPRGPFDRVDDVEHQLAGADFPDLDRGRVADAP